MRFMHTFCIAVVGDALAACSGLVEPARTHVGARKFKHTPNFGMLTHGSYVQPAIFVFQQIQLAGVFPFWGTRG